MKIAVLLSGGVDSSVALHLLHREGHELTAYYLKIWLEDETSFLGECPWEEDLEYARAVCNQLNVPLKVINMQREYYDTVVDYTLTELRAGRTPSPDIQCNKQVKFGKFFDKIDDSFDKVASGHYAQVEEENGIFKLKRSPDAIKDQTYFLTYLDQAQLSRIIFPLGNYTKSQVRELADEFELPNAKRHDSQGICFLGKIKYNDFVKFHLGTKEGSIVNIENNEKLGTHNGYWFHTIGQRSGLGLSGGPWYVARKDHEHNVIYVSHNPIGEDIPKDNFYAREVNWISGRPASNRKLELKTKIRHGAFMYDSELDLITPNRAHVKLSKPDQGISEGQYSIFYDGQYCLGGGIIELPKV